ncbi:MAG: adenylyltransferase [Acidiferrobacteraceae bacterium]|nr:adenylyltransferase [Acidiferrobacteraceae bacterium]
MNIVDKRRAAELRELTNGTPSITLNRREQCDLELLANGAFSPLVGFMTQLDYNQVVQEGRLYDGSLWPMPIVLSISDQLSEHISVGDVVALRDAEGFMLAALNVGDLWKPNRILEAEAVYGTTSTEHPGVNVILEAMQTVYIGGNIEVLELPTHYDFELLRHTPHQLTQEFHKKNWKSVVAFQTSRPMHRLQRDLVLEVAQSENSHVLIHPVVGQTKPGDLEYYARVCCYQAILKHFPQNMALLSLLPLAMRMAGPREALWHGLIHRNYGCAAFIVGPDDSSPPSIGGSDKFYTKYAAQDYIANFGEELGIEMLPIEERSYSSRHSTFLPLSAMQKNKEKPTNFSDRDLRQALSNNRTIPDWFSFSDVTRCLSTVYPSSNRVGITLFFTGFSGSGKSTLAGIMRAKLIENGQRPVTLLDGDIVRRNLSSELGFSRAHRDLNIRRIGFVANEISKNGGIAICAPIAPYRAIRREIRSVIEARGVFIEIYLSTPLFVCEERDRKGLYAKARAGQIAHFTGVSDPYEPPEHAELVLDTSKLKPAECCKEIFDYLYDSGLVDMPSESG